MIKYTPEVLRKVQLSELELLIELDRICRKCGISYQLDGGTLLGAVRNKGFIPWDDDIDVRLLRDDYDAFTKACETELDTERFFFQTYHTDPGYRWGYGKLLLKRTYTVREHQEMLTMRHGLIMDIFPCDNMPEKGIKKMIFNFRCFFARKCSYSPVGAKYESNILKRVVYKFLSKIPKKMYVKEFEKLAYMYNNQDMKYVRQTGWGNKQEAMGFPRKWLEESCEIEFEGHKFFAPKDYDGFLRRLYGDDYMTPPPPEKQVSVLTLSYLDLGDGTVLGSIPEGHKENRF